MSPLIDDQITEAATSAYLKSTPRVGQTVMYKDIRAALLAALPMIGERLASEAESEADKVETLRHRLRFYDEGLAVIDTAVNHLRAFAARIRELTGAKP